MTMIFNPLDMLFEALEEEEPDHVAVRGGIRLHKRAAGKSSRAFY